MCATFHVYCLTYVSETNTDIWLIANGYTKSYFKDMLHHVITHVYKGHTLLNGHAPAAEFESEL